MGLPTDKSDVDLDPTKGLDDGRDAWDWKTKYPQEARALIRVEASITGAYLLFFLISTFVCASFGAQSSEIVALSHTFIVDVKLV